MRITEIVDVGHFFGIPMAIHLHQRSEQNPRKMKNLFVLFTLPLFLVSFTLLQEYVDYKISDDFTMTIKGTSNVHDWESSVEKVTGTAKVTFDDNGALHIEACTVNIPVTSIKSTKGSIMDKKTWKALKSDEYANIKYQLTDFGNLVKSSNGFTTNTTGKLTIAGKTKTVNISVKGRELDNGSIEITGSKALKMTDYGIDPPTALLGAMTTGDDVTIEFRVILSQQ